MVYCQVSWCEEKATMAVQIMDLWSLWAGVCKEHAEQYCDHVHGDINDKRFAIPIEEVHWYPRRATKKEKKEIEKMIAEARANRKQSRIRTENGGR